MIPICMSVLEGTLSLEAAGLNKRLSGVHVQVVIGEMRLILSGIPINLELNLYLPRVGGDEGSSI